jgi:hypothetical protein
MYLTLSCCFLIKQRDGAFDPMAVLGGRGGAECVERWATAHRSGGGRGGGGDTGGGFESAVTAQLLAGVGLETGDLRAGDAYIDACGGIAGTTASEQAARRAWLAMGDATGRRAESGPQVPGFRSVAARLWALRGATGVSGDLFSDVECAMSGPGSSVIFILHSYFFFFPHGLNLFFLFRWTDVDGAFADNRYIYNSKIKWVQCRRRHGRWQDPPPRCLDSAAQHP